VYGFARIDFLLVIAFLGVAAAAVWRALTHGLIAEEIPLYLAALLIPIYWGAVLVANIRLKKRRSHSDGRSS